VTSRAKKIAVVCSLVQFEPKCALRKLRMVARLCAELQTHGGFDSLHPLHFFALKK
jgi:hypothetical protein